MSNIKGKKYEVINAWRGNGDFDDLFENGDIVVALENNSFAPLVIYEKYYSDELDKPFGLYSAVLEAFIGGYAKR